MKIKQKDIKMIREELLKEQSNICPLCLEVITIDKAVLDHNHKTGYIRATLHRGCNAMLGKIENNAVRNLIVDLPGYLIGAANYIEAPETELIHPSHRTPEEKLQRTKARAKKAYQRRKKK